MNRSNLLQLGVGGNDVPKNAPLTLMKYNCFLCGIPKARKTCKTDNARKFNLRYRYHKDNCLNRLFEFSVFDKYCIYPIDPSRVPMNKFFNILMISFLFFSGLMRIFKS
jgi:hypothetical protein